MSYFLIQYYLHTVEVKNYLVPKSELNDEAIAALYCVNGLMSCNIVETQEQTNSFDLIDAMVCPEMYKHMETNQDNPMLCILEKFLLPENCTVQLPEGTEFIRTGLFL